MSVKIMGGKPANPPKPMCKADIQGQGSIPYAKATMEKTPDTAMGKITTGKKRGMGAALRGGDFRIA